MQLAVMVCYFRKLLFCTFFFINLCVITRSDYILQVQVLSYASSFHLKYNGFCCGDAEEYPNCTEHCNNRFTFCLRTAGLDPESAFCPTDTYQTGVISNDMMVFDGDRDLDARTGVPNPLIFTGERWPGSMEFYVRVDNGDPTSVTGQQGPSNSETLVARILVLVSADPVVDNASFIAEPAYSGLQNLGHFIRLTFQLSCAEDFYGSDCTRVCFERDDEGGHFVCNSEGDMECREGFQNPQTNCTECALAPDCSPVGGYCNSTDGCICRDEYIGINCAEFKDPCSQLSPCLNGATCRNEVYTANSTVRYTCECPNGYRGGLCEVEQNVDPCNSQPCANGGTCSSDDSGTVSYTCECPGGFGGGQCEVEQNVDPCNSQPCANGGTCNREVPADGSNVGGYTCECPDGYEGGLCESEQNIDLCSSQPCTNGGTCVPTGGSTVGYTCECPDGYRGGLCEVEVEQNIDPCNSQPCANGGTCNREVPADGSNVGGYTCECPDGYEGGLCESEQNIDLCSSQPCTNGGTCVPTGGSTVGYTCECPDGYRGGLCEVEVEQNIDPCNSQPCANGGTCSGVVPSADSSTVSFTCECPDGYEGKLCELDTNECSSNPCANGGTCQDKVAAFECSCTSGYGGTNCDVEKSFLGPFIGTSVAIGVLFVIIIFLAVLLFCTIWRRNQTPKKKWQKKNTVAYSCRQCSSSPVMNPGEVFDPEQLNPNPNNTHSNSRIMSETFDNPIYDQPSPLMDKTGGSFFFQRNASTSKLGSESSSKSQSLVSLSCSPSGARPAGSSPAHHHHYDYITDDKPEECLNAMFRILGNPQESNVQQMNQNIAEMEKLSVINETYDHLSNSSAHNQLSICSANPRPPYDHLSISSANPPQHIILKDSSATNGPVAGHPIVMEFTTTEVLDNGFAGSEPNMHGTQRLQQKLHDGVHANSYCNIETA